MKLNEEQYYELIDKLADEILEDGMEVTASEEATSKEEQVKALIEAKKKEMKEKESAGEEKEAGEGNDEIAEKAAAVHEYAMNKIAACEAFYQEAMEDQAACLEILAEAGILTDDGIDKEAAEADEETAEIVNKLADCYEAAEEKKAAAQEKYAEACEEVNASLEVLAELGYELA